MKMENFGVRDRFLLRTTLGITYGTSVSQVRQVRDGLRKVLEEHKLIWPDNITVRFEGFGSSSLDIEIRAWVLTRDVAVFREVREEIYLMFMDVIEGAGCSFAFPTQTIHLQKHE